MSNWISVDERLPDEDVDVLVYCDNEWMEVSWQHNSFFYDIMHEIIPVTHWMPLPEPPSE